MEEKILIIFSMGIILLFMLLFLNKKKIKIDFSKVVLYFGIGAFIFMSGEIFLGFFIEKITGYSLWQYQNEATYNGYSHKNAWLLWGVYGVYSYLSYLILSSKKYYSKYKQGGLTAIDGIVFEIYINIIFIFFTGNYLFFYSPSDLNHFSTLLVLPLYFIVGLIIFVFSQFFIENNIKTEYNYKVGLFFILLGYTISTINIT